MATRRPLVIVAGIIKELPTEDTLGGLVLDGTGVNDIINGAFRIASRGTSFVSPTTNTYDLPGWANTNSSGGLFTISQAAGSTSAKLCRLLTVTTADNSIATGDLVIAGWTRIEGYDCVKYIGNTFTIGFTVKSSITGIHCISIYDGTNSYIAEYTITSANTWETKSITVVGGLSVLSSYSNAFGIQMNFTSMAGTTYQGTAGWSVGNKFATSNQVNDIATVGNIVGLQDVSINLGTSVYSNNIDISQDIIKCSRYHPVIQTTNYLDGHCISTTQAWVVAEIPETRVKTTGLVTTVSGNLYNLSSAVTLTALSRLDSGKTSILMLASVASGLTAGYGTKLYTANPIILTGAEL